MTVLITTHDLEPAVRLRDAFVAADIAVELVTPGERIADVPDPALLVLTGGLDEKQARRLAREAAALDRLPVIALFDNQRDATPEARAALGASEAIVKPIDAKDVALVGRRLIDRRTLREFTGIIGDTDAMIEVLEKVVQIGRGEGETCVHSHRG
jgi:DNA-binding response OmpR family regulator